MLDIIIPVANRDIYRVRLCIESLGEYNVHNCIYVVEYGSMLSMATTIFGDKKGMILKVPADHWNKAHALNIGIKEGKNPYIMCLDCDMLLPPDAIKKITAELWADIFMTTRNVKRVKLIEDELASYEDIYELIKKGVIETSDWKEADPNFQFAIGGLQVFSRVWINCIGGYDEYFDYWGGEDIDLRSRAVEHKLRMVDLPFTIYHQEHDKRKEDQIPDPEERKKATEKQKNRTEYILSKLNNKNIVNKKPWGEW